MKHKTVVFALASIASIASLGMSAPVHALHTGLVGDVFVDFDPRLVRPSGVIESSLLGLTCGTGLAGFLNPCGGYAIAPTTYSAPIAAPVAQVAYAAPAPIIATPVLGTACAGGCLTTFLPFSDCPWIW